MSKPVRVRTVTNIDAGKPVKKRKVSVPRPMVLAISKTSTTPPLGASSSRTLHAEPIDAFAFGTNTNERERNKILLKGVTLDHAIRNTSTAVRIYRWAIIMPRTNQLIANLTDNFITGFDGEKGLDFSTTRTGLQLCHWPINKAVYNVIAQGSETVAGTGASDNNGVIPNFRNWRTYVPINKILTFDTNITLGPYERTFFVQWWDNPLVSSGTATDVNFTSTFVCTRYFRDAI